MQIKWKEEWPQLGDRVREVITGHEGIVTGFSGFLWGCEQVCVGRTDKDDKLDTTWYDVARVEVIERAAQAPVKHHKRKNRAGKGHGADVLPVPR